MTHRIAGTAVADVWTHYVAKVERKGRTQDELREVTRWLTGYDDAALDAHLAAGTTFADFFAQAQPTPALTGTVCGVRVQEVEDPLMRQVRSLDLLVDELARGKALVKVLRR